MKAKKSFGQHFLKHDSIASQIADALLLTSQYDNVLEVGPGKGKLTQFLLEKDYKLKVVEADEDMVAYLKKNLPALGEGNIISSDFLKINFESLFGKESVAVIGNFPYNISSQIVFKVVENRHQVPEMVGMFQKEMAERIVSQPNSKAYGVISVLTQAYYEGDYLFTVDKSAFAPPPKVQSAVIRLRRKENQSLGVNPSLFKQIVKQTFGQRRKMLRNTLKSFLKENEILNEAIFSKRPENLSVDDFKFLTQLVENNRNPL